MFLGTHTPRLDEKGRLILPAKFREDLKDGLVITQAQDRCLAIWPTAAFLEQTREISTAPSSSRQVRNYQRMVAASASAETPDKQGRITIPLHLRSYAGLDKDCVVVGAMNRVEVWDAVAWATYSAEQQAAFADMDDPEFPGL